MNIFEIIEKYSKKSKDEVLNKLNDRFWIEYLLSNNLWNVIKWIFVIFNK